MTSLLLTGIGELTTHDPGHGPEPVRGAALVVEQGRVAWTGASDAAPAADTAYDVGGRAVIPGFVDSHSHLVFAGDRSEEFAARMTGTPYSAGGIRTTVAATRAATDEQLLAHAARLVEEMRRQGTTTVEIKSGYGLTVRDEARSLVGRAPAHRRDHLPRRPRRARGHHPRRVRRPGDRADAGGLRSRMRGGSTCSASGARSTPTRPARCSPPVPPRGCAAGCTPTSSGPDPACSSPASSVWSRWTTAPTSTTPTSPPWPTPAPSRRCCPGWSSPPGRPTPTPAASLDAGVRVALASDCNPGSCYTSSMPLCVALAVREMGLSPTEAARRRDPRRCGGPGPRRCRPPARRSPRRPRGPRGSVVRPPRLPPRRTARPRGPRRRPPDRAVTRGYGRSTRGLTRGKRPHLVASAPVGYPASERSVASMSVTDPAGSVIGICACRTVPAWSSSSVCRL